MRIIIVIFLSVAFVAVQAQQSTGVLTLERAVTDAIQADPWQQGSQLRQQALTDESIAAGSLPDPSVSLTAGNLPLDSFSLHQEAMTHLSVGVSQAFPRGETQALSRQQKQELASGEPLLRFDRKAMVRLTVSRLWLEIFQAQQSIKLIEDNRFLFEQLVEATVTGYSSALAGARQQDVIRAQLELTRLDDRLTQLKQGREAAQQRLSEWLGSQALIPVADHLPDSLRKVHRMIQDISLSSTAMVEQHPVLQAFNRKIAAMQTGVELARQQYRPQWAVSAQYGFRASDTTGHQRADLLTVGVSLDVPLFTSNRQDRQVSAATAQAEAIRTDKLLVQRQLAAQLETAVSQVQHLDERDSLYATHLLPQMTEQAEAALTAYYNDDGDFAEAVRARIARLNATIDALAIQVARQRELAMIDYLTTRVSDGKFAQAGGVQ